MNFLDAFIDEKIRKLYLKIMAIDHGNKKYINKTIEHINIREKIRIFKIVINLKSKYEMDFSDDQKRMDELIEKSKLLKNGKCIKRRE
jgi:hypothetical protein